ncbi:hypothetical protein OWR29_38785 [Actinoplanes sp. Pm04-4]|uniref:Uncharacterized protein n=1 Tax=Paractinoplanes pyxinae TaxID=2997416 RepID=A0ABT4BBT6_9ACTN|nr:hypothetical protein [Actinoplanes pyxinae]MCY1143978.1 hypothetical protein [Actinoplanes pyxinae]
MTSEQPRQSPGPPAQRPPAEPLRPPTPGSSSTDDKVSTAPAPAATVTFVDKAERRRGWLRKRPAPAAAPTAPAAAPAASAAAPATIPAQAAPPAREGKTQTAEGPQKTTKRPEPLPTERPPGTPPDPWHAFAATAERPPGWFRRTTRRFARSLIHEYALVTYLGVLMAVALTWPTLRYPLHTLPQDIWDPSRQAWQIAWIGHTLLTDPIHLWQSNAFFPLADSYAFGNSLLGYAPFGMIGEGPQAAVLRYNILFVLAHALLLIGGYALVRQLGAGRTGAAVAAVAFAFAPWRLAQEGHLDIISAGGIPLALAMLARGHGWSLRRGLRPDRRRPGWAAAGWIVASWQVSLGFSLGVPFLYVLGLLLVVIVLGTPIRFLRRPAERPILGSRLMLIDLSGASFLAAFSFLLAIPYFRVPDSGPAGTEIAFFSPPLRGLLIGPAESRIWGAPHQVPRSSLGWPAEMGLLPGFVLYALALAGLAFSIWTLRQRLLLLAALAVTIVLTLGTNFYEGRYSYLPLFGHLPASLGLRIPGRLMIWATLLLAILAAGAVAEFVRRAEHLSEQRIPPWPGPWLRLATFVPLMLVLVEGWNATAHPVAPAQPTAMRTVSGPMLVLPTGALADQTVMLWSTSRFQPMANGAGGFGAARQTELYGKVLSFPDAASVEYLRSINIKRVLLVRGESAGTPWERAGDIPVDALGIRREDADDGVVFHLDDKQTPSSPLPTPGLPTQPAQPTLPQPTQPALTTQPGVILDR